MGFIPSRKGEKLVWGLYPGARGNAGPRVDLVIIQARGGPRVGFIPSREGSAGPRVGVITQARGSNYGVISWLSRDKNAGSSLVVMARRDKG